MPLKLINHLKSVTIYYKRVIVLYKDVDISFDKINIEKNCLIFLLKNKTFYVTQYVYRLFVK